MTERPILFSGPMVRAILAGRKTQTRRIVKHRHDWYMGERANGAQWPFVRDYVHAEPDAVEVLCPYGVPVDALWVRETWGLHAHSDYTWWCRDSIKGRTEDDLRESYDVAYAADATSAYDRWRPSIHMLRWASRITLRVTDVRVERLQEISEEDARAEGVYPLCGGYCAGDADAEWCTTAREAFELLWTSIHGASSWESNLWVWVVSFEWVNP